MDTQMLAWRLWMRTVDRALAAVVVSLIPVVAQAQDWSGAYAAVTLSDTTVSLDEYRDGTLLENYAMEGRSGGLAVGYNLQNGNWVYGAELAYSAGEVGLVRRPADNYLDGMVDLKARAGYAAGKVLWYGSVGWAQAGRYYAGPVPNEPVTASGVTYGLGVEALLTDRVFAGIEMQQRDLKIDEGEIGGFLTDREDYDVRTVTLRLGMRF